MEIVSRRQFLAAGTLILTARSLFKWDRSG
jgi:hypothetical protein